MAVNPYQSPRADEITKQNQRLTYQKRLILYVFSALSGGALVGLMWIHLLGTPRLVAVLPFCIAAIVLGGGCGVLATNIAITPAQNH